ncbi:hypothetical protein [Acinetobacter sp. ANC 4640]
MEHYQDILNRFLERWPVNKVKEMTLDQYVSTGDKDTFCQWVENGTLALGSIKGIFGSRMFGIYKRLENSTLIPNYENDSTHTWMKQYGSDKKLAYEQVKGHVINIIKYSMNGKFSQIDDIPLPDIFKWKVAYLYSNERLIPIFNREILNSAAIYYNLEVNNKTTISEIQHTLINNKPLNLSPHEFMKYLYEKFHTNNKATPISDNSQNKKNTDEQNRSGTSSYIATQTHNKIQNKLREMLINEFGSSNVECEKNFVDLILHQPDSITLYEVKSDAYAAKCIRQALGQILEYAHNFDLEKKIKLVVAGPSSLNQNEKPYFEYIKSNLNLEFDYINIPLDD